MKAIVGFLMFCILAMGTLAQQEQQAPDQEQPRQEPLPAGHVSLPLPRFDPRKESSSRPDAPIAKDDHEKTPCPAGEFKPCAFLGGMSYVRDRGGLTQHDKSVWRGFRNPFILIGSSMLVAATVYDIEGTQACLSSKTCRELNPLMGSRPSRLKAYSISMPINGFVIYMAARQKRRGDGNTAFGALYILSAVHAYFGKAAYAAVR